MPQTPRNRAATVPTLAGLVLLVGLTGLVGSGCSSSESKATWAGAEDLRFSEDAQDPTERETEDGWYRFRPLEEPVGSASPLDDSRRTHGFGEANNKP
ncbi:MAG: hypothetical protein ACI89L_002836 [Phycisphaerales bacterium]|jgi:hypothetical protein